MDASIVVINFNYDRYLGKAIESALRQSHDATEVIVVDDGSTDGSAKTMQSFGSRIRPVYKENGGHASAFNAGFQASCGDVVIFLDADDLLYPNAVETVLPLFARDDTLTRAQWRMEIVDVDGLVAGADSHWVRENRAKPPLDEGDLRERVMSGGPFMYQWSHTSGNAWSRRCLEAVLPIPEPPFWNTAEIYLSALCPLFGTVKVVHTPLSGWRDHHDNFTTLQRKHDFERELAWGLERFECILRSMTEVCAEQGYQLNRATWLANSWFHRLQRATDAITQIIPEGATCVLADQDAWFANGTLRGRRCIPFSEHEGRYWGLPGSDQEAIEELERLRRGGARFFCLPWSAFWMLEFFPGLSEHLTLQDRSVFESSDLKIFEL